MTNNQFNTYLQQLNITLTQEQLNQLEKYYELLVSENQKYNLTSITDKELVYLKHFFDSLTLSKIVTLSDQSLCDIGTGAGFPGLVLKIAFPHLKLTLVEASQKKCHFLKMVTEKLNLSDVIIENNRAEIYSSTTREKFDIVTSRAVAPLAHLLEYSVPLVKVNGLYIAMKSDITQELKDTKNYENILSIKLQDQLSFQLPIENSLRTLISYKKMSPTSSKYPRKYNEIKRKHL